MALRFEFQISYDKGLDTYFCNGFRSEQIPGPAANIDTSMRLALKLQGKRWKTLKEAQDEIHGHGFQTRVKGNKPTSS